MSDERLENIPQGEDSRRPGLALAVACLTLCACEDMQSQFIGTRVLEPCDGTWNVCATRVGCYLGDRSYVGGRFPGTEHVGIELFEPSTVTVSFYLSEVAGAGETTAITLFEGSCTTPQRVEVTGKTFVGEAEKVGFVKRSANLMGVGDHLIQVESDARTKYLMKIDVLALRLQDSSG